MNQHRRLSLRREALAELSPGDLAAVNGALPISVPNPICVIYVSGIRQCTPDLSLGCGA